MAILKTAKLGNPVLRKMARPLLPGEIDSIAIQRLIDDMIETMREYDGVGLAAPQVHEPKQIVVIESKDNRRYPGSPTIPLTVLINPTFLFQSKEKEEGWEGCLSIQDLRGKVPRSTRVGVKGFDRKGADLSFEAEGFLAVILQHELDHLQGKVFLDRVADFSTLTHLKEFERFWLKGGGPAQSRGG